MEQIITVFGIDWRLLLIQAVNFGVVLFILQRFLYKPVLKMIDERRSKIEKGVREASEAHDRLGRAEAEAKTLIEEAEREARNTELLSKKAAESKASAIMKEAEEKKIRETEETAREAASLKQKAILESQDEIARLSILAAEKILSKQS